MNRGDSQRIARSLKAAFKPCIERQTASTAWFVCIEAVADALEDCAPSFNREEFLASCRGGGAPSVGQDQEIES